jgi:hypothetical protein
MSDAVFPDYEGEDYAEAGGCHRTSLQSRENGERTHLGAKSSLKRQMLSSVFGIIPTGECENLTLQLSFSRSVINV